MRIQEKVLRDSALISATTLILAGIVLLLGMLIVFSMTVIGAFVVKSHQSHERAKHS